MRYARRCKRAHPRACGENFSTRCAPCSRLWLIPAHAGKTPMPTMRTLYDRAHPRACGENPKDAQWIEAQEGSSPRMRGKLVEGRSERGFPRLIPAHAGKTPSHTNRHPYARAHPRACGENFQTLLKMSLTEGSSPRMRGKRVHQLISRLTTGLIPAHAGKTNC